MPPELARWLREAGHDAQHVEDVGLREGSDGAIWAHALQSGAVIVTKDEDFAARSVGSDGDRTGDRVATHRQHDEPGVARVD